MEGLYKHEHGKDVPAPHLDGTVSWILSGPQKNVDIPLGQKDFRVRQADKELDITFRLIYPYTLNLGDRVRIFDAQGFKRHHHGGVEEHPIVRPEGLYKLDADGKPLPDYYFADELYQFKEMTNSQ